MFRSLQFDSTSSTLSRMNLKSRGAFHTAGCSAFEPWPLPETTPASVVASATAALHRHARDDACWGWWWWWWHALQCIRPRFPRPAAHPPTRETSALLRPEARQNAEPTCCFVLRRSAPKLFVLSNIVRSPSRARLLSNSFEGRPHHATSAAPPESCSRPSLSPLSGCQAPGPRNQLRQQILSERF